MTSKERLLERLKLIARLVAAENPDAQLDHLRTMTPLLLTALGQVRGEIVAGCYGEGERIAPESLMSILEEQRAIAVQAIASAAQVMRILQGDTAAQQYQEAASAELEAVTTDPMPAAEGLAAEQLERTAAEADHLDLIDEIFLTTRRGN